MQNGDFSQVLPPDRRLGFTLIELLVVLAIVATLLTLAAPRYFGSVDKAKESTLKQNLFLIRDSIDKYMADNGHYPATLQALVDKRYLRAIPVDPLTERNDTWRIITPAQVQAAAPASPASGQQDFSSPTDVPNYSGNPAADQAVFDIRSTAVGTGRDGTPYSSW